MAWRLPTSVWKNGKGIKNKRAMKRRVTAGTVPGILAYQGNQPIGWCSVAPREEFVFLSHSRVLAPLDQQKVWSISCLFVQKEFRRKNLSVKLLKAAIQYVRKRKGKVVEAYPVIPYSVRMPDAFAWTGTLPAFVKAGFREAGRKSRSRPIMRYYL